MAIQLGKVLDHEVKSAKKWNDTHNPTLGSLYDRAEQIEGMLVKTEDKLKKRIKGEVVGSHVEHGRWVNSYANQRAFNILKRALRSTQVSIYVMEQNI